VVVVQEEEMVLMKCEMQSVKSEVAAIRGTRNLLFALPALPL
jgi:hypothetical protein